MTEPGPSVGHVSVTVRPDARGWANDVRRQTLADAPKLGREWGDAFWRGVEASRTPSFGPSDRQMQQQGSRSAGAFADAFRAKLAAAARSMPPIQVGVAATEAEQKLKDLKAELLELSGKTVGVDLTDTEALAKLDELRARLAELNATAESVSVRADTGEALAKLEALRAEVDAMTSGRHDVDVDVDDHGSFASVGAAAENAAGDFGGMSARAKLIGAAVVAASAVAIPALLAIGGAATAAFAGIGVGVLGLSGVGAALRAAGKPSTGGGGGGSSSGPNKALQGIQAQQRSLAARQATQAAQDRLAQATRNRADAVLALAGAEKDLTTAQKNVITAQQGVTAAQKDLNAARKQAKQDLEDLDNKVKDNALAQKQAAIRLSEAKRTLARTEVAPGRNLPQYADQVAQAKLDVQTAQQQLNELKLQGSRLGPQDQRAHAAGVEGSAGVVAAKQKVADANAKVVAANSKVVDANQKVAKSQRDLTVSTHDLAEARQNIKDTALSNSLTKQAAAASAAGAGAAAAAGGVNQFAQAMAKLNPLQKQFVEFLLSLKPLWDKVKLAASGFLPGLEKGIKNALPAFQPFLKVISSVAKAMGDVFARIGAWIGSTQGKQFLNWVSTVLPGIIEGAGDLFIGLFKTVASYGPKFWPLVKQFVDVAGQLASTIGHILLGLTPLTGPFLDFFSTLLKTLDKLVKPVLTPLAKVTGELLKAVAPLLPLLGQLVQAVLPPMLRFLDKLIRGPLTAFVDALVKSLAPVMPQINQAMVDFFNALIPLLLPLGQILVALTPLLPLLVKLALVAIQPLTELLLLLAPALRGLATVMTKYVAPALDWLNKQMDKYLRVTQRVLSDVKGAWHTAYTIVKGWIDSMVSRITGVWDSAYGTVRRWMGTITGAVTGAWSRAYGDVKQWINDIVGYVRGVPGKIKAFGTAMLDAGKHLMGKLFDGFTHAAGAVGNFAATLGKAVVNKVIDGLNAVIPHKLHIHIPIPAAPDVNINIPLVPKIPHIATGGLTNGLTAAIVGDNPSGNELIAPMDSPKTVELLAAAMSKALSSGTITNPKMDRLMSPGFAPRSKAGIGAVNIYGAADPYATAHFVANRIAARRG